MSHHRHLSLIIPMLAILLAGCTMPTPTPAPTAVPVPPTATRVPPTATLAPTPTSVLPTPTSVPPSRTVQPPAPTRVPPSPTALLPTPPPKESAVTLSWLGQSTFLLKTNGGLVALLDPMASNMGYAVKPVEGVDVVTLSHEHADHNNTALAAGSPMVLRGLSGSDWAKIDQKVKGVRIYTIPTFHDDTQGSARGKNAIFAFDVDGLRVVHLGDLGHMLGDDQIRAIGPVDVLLIPIGGFFTVDGKTAAEVVRQVQARVVIPMHYATPDLAASTAARLTNTEPFLAALGPSAKVSPAGNTITISSLKRPAEQTIMVMTYK